MNHNFNLHKISHTISSSMRKCVWKIRGATDRHFGVVFMIDGEADREAGTGSTASAARVSNIY